MPKEAIRVTDTEFYKDLKTGLILFQVHIITIREGYEIEISVPIFETDPDLMLDALDTLHREIHEIQRRACIDCSEDEEIYTTSILPYSIRLFLKRIFNLYKRYQFERSDFDLLINALQELEEKIRQAWIKNPLFYSCLQRIRTAIPVVRDLQKRMR